MGSTVNQCEMIGALLGLIEDRELEMEILQTLIHRNKLLIDELDKSVQSIRSIKNDSQNQKVEGD